MKSEISGSKSSSASTRNSWRSASSGSPSLSDPTLTATVEASNSTWVGMPSFDCKEELAVASVIFAAGSLTNLVATYKVPRSCSRELMEVPSFALLG